MNGIGTIWRTTISFCNHVCSLIREQKYVNIKETIELSVIHDHDNVFLLIIYQRQKVFSSGIFSDIGFHHEECFSVGIIC